MAFRASAVRANRAIVYTQNGEPSQVLSSLTFKALPPPAPNSLNIRFLLSPVNPADINVIQGVYPAKPALTPLVNGDPVFVGGNEGLAEVTQVGSGVSGLTRGDWVVMTKSQAGTWSSSKNVGSQDVLKLPRAAGLTEVHGATMTVNPPTAYNMLNDFVTLEKNEWVVQNGANSAVGQAVIQIAASRGLKTLNLVRKRFVDLDDLTKKLKALGGTEILTYDDLADRALTKTIIKDWTAGKGIRLGLNCVSGKDTTSMARLLGDDAYLVSYGAMSKEPLSLPTSLFIFKNLTTAGFWQTRWYNTHTRQDKENLMKTLVDLVLKEPEHEILTIAAQDSDEVAGQKVRDILAKVAKGQYGKKVLFKIEGTE
ncbi:NAD(P)-binding protein [Mycena epipterygia]|nr:NAD(P)-binding protein [Mycena epipterygia]